MSRDFLKGMMVGMSQGTGIIPPPAPVTWQRFRVNISAKQGASLAYTGIRDMEIIGVDGIDLCPVMTSDTTLGVTTSASSVYGVGYEAWKAFNNDASTDLWASTIVPAWLAVNFGVQKTVKAYTIRVFPNTPDHFPKSWTFEGSNDGITWTVLDTRLNVPTWALDQRRVFVLGG